LDHSSQRPDGRRKRQVDIRDVVKGAMYLLRTGCQWGYLPKDLPPKSTMHDYFARWDCDGTLRKIHH
jgi:transposase